MNLTVIGWALALGLVAAGGGYWRGDTKGYQRGVLETQAAHDASQVKTLTDGLQQLRTDVRDSSTANTQVRAALTRLERQNKTSNSELRDAIAKSRPAGAVVCRFDADSMRILQRAADRADDLAAGGIPAGGTGGALPAGGTPDR